MSGGDEQDAAGLEGDFALLQLLHDFARLPEYSEELSWLRVVEGLLQFCRKRQPAPAAWDGLPAGLVMSVVAGIEASVASVLDPTPSGFPAEGQLIALAEIASREMAMPPVIDGSFAEALVARGIAGGIDAISGASFVDWFRAEIEFEIKPSVAYFTPVHDPRSLMGAQRPNSRPDRAPSRSLDSVPHLRLGDAVTGRYRFVLDFDMYFHLAPLANEGASLRLAAAQPNLSVAEFDVEWIEGPPRTFRNQGPKDPERQGDLVIRAVEQASAARASVVVVPEYCLTVDQRNRVAATLDSIDPRPVLVIAGTCEVPDPAVGGNRNEAWIYLPDDPDMSYGREIELPDVETTHSRLTSTGVEYTDRAVPGLERSVSKIFPAEVGGYGEAVVSATEVPVFCTESVTFAVLICRDAMSQEIVDALADIGVNLLLVPAFSPKSGTIIGNAATLSIRSQAFVVVACAPAFWPDGEIDEDAPRDGSGRVEAAFSGPYEESPTLRTYPNAQEPATGRGVWVFDAALKGGQWMPIQ